MTLPFENQRRRFRCGPGNFVPPYRNVAEMTDACAVPFSKQAGRLRSDALVTRVHGLVQLFTVFAREKMTLPFENQRRRFRCGPGNFVPPYRNVAETTDACAMPLFKQAGRLRSDAITTAFS